MYKSSQEAQSCAGCIYDLGTHLMDQMVSLFGVPAQITAFLANQRVEAPSVNGDSFTVLLHYPEGFLVTLKAAVKSLEAEQLRFWVRGEKGSFKKFHEDLQEVQLNQGVSKPGVEGFGVDPESHYGMLGSVVGDGVDVDMF